MFKPRAPTKNAAYRGIIPYEEVFAKVPEAKGLLGNAIDVWGSPDGYCITYPISAGKDLNLVLSHHRPDYVEDVQEVDMNELRDFYKDYDPIIKKVIDLVPHSLRWPLLVTGPLEAGRVRARTLY
jgi:salicylate hydroxylase